MNTGLDLSNLELALLGREAGSQTVTGQGTKIARAGYYDAQGNLVSTDRNTFYSDTRENTGPRHSRRGPTGFDDQTRVLPAGVTWRNKGETLTGTTTTVATPAQRGLLDIYTQDLAPRLQQTQADTTAANYASLRNLNPNSAALFDSLQSDAAKGLQLGNRLAPEDAWRITQGVRGDWANRGLGTALPAGMDEALQLYGGGEQLGQQRRANATNALALDQSLYQTPALGMSPGVGAGEFLSGAGGYAKQPSVLDRLTGYGSDLNSSNFNADASSRINQANTRNANISGGAQAGVGIASALLLACWAAREVFGEERIQNSKFKIQKRKWKIFRHWLLTRASEKFRNWYLEHGPVWAFDLSRNPRAKSIVRRFMEKKILEVQHGL